MQEVTAFITCRNVLDFAIGVIIDAALGKIVSSLTATACQSPAPTKGTTRALSVLGLVGKNEEPIWNCAQ